VVAVAVEPLQEMATTVEVVAVRRSLGLPALVLRVKEITVAKAIAVRHSSVEVVAEPGLWEQQEPQQAAAAQGWLPQLPAHL